MTSRLYLPWESACEKVFQVNDISKEKKSCYAIAHFEGYANTWWEYVKHFGDELVDQQPPPWFLLRYLMRQRYLSENYRHKLLARLYNLRQGNKSVMAYYDEFSTTHVET